MIVHLKLMLLGRGGGDVKSEAVEAKPSTLQEISEFDTDTLFDKIGKLFDLKTGFMVTDIQFNIATDASELKLDIENNASELKSDMTNLKSDLK